MSSLIPERQLIISPALAATIGLEESVMLQVLTEISTFADNREHRGYQWYEITRARLQELLPFWNDIDLQRVSKSLTDKGIILLNSPPLTESENFCFAMNETQANVAAAAQAPTVTANQRGAGLLSPGWTPDEDLLQLLALNHSIPRNFSLSQLEDFVLYWRERNEISHAWGNKFRQHVLKEWRRQQSRQHQAEQTPASEVIEQRWQPSLDALEILYRNGVSQDFIEDAVPEFILYWRERGIADSTWNSKFIAHIRRQWHKFSHSLKHDYEPQPIAANWQPSEDTFDIIKLANIDRDFAKELVAEFVLFWRDTGEIQRSWNSKFLQHVKYQWATRHHMGQQHAGQSVAHQSAKGSAQSTFQRLTDRSWAEGLVSDD
jgi:hypothetical protein